MGYKMEARGYTGAESRGGAKASRKSISRDKTVVAGGGCGSGIIELDAQAFAEFEKCMTSNQKPTKAMVQAAELHKQLRKARS